jgi:integrase
LNFFFLGIKSSRRVYMHRGKEIVLLKKPVRGKKVWYFYYYFTDDGVNYTRSNRFSVGLDVDLENIQKSERQALRMAKHIKFKKEQDRKNTQTKDLFSIYTQNWFIWGKCPFILAEERRGRTLSRSNADNNRRILEKHILPSFKNLRLSEITPAHIENWLFKLQHKGLSGRTINIYYTTMQIILGEATRLGDLTVNPCLNVKRMAEKKKERVILTMDEFRTLLGKNALDEVWDDQLMYFTMTLLGASCGLRIGEIQALRNEYIDLKSLELKICHSWDRKYGLVPTKTKDSRIVPITPYIAQYLRRCQDQNHFGHVFSFQDGEQPVDHKSIGKYFKRALMQIGISEDEIKDRGLTFHSLRHFANSYFNDHFDQSVTMKVIGHSTTEMNMHYDHATQDRLERIREVIRKMNN